MASTTDRLPAPLSERLASAASTIYARQGREVDVAVGGIPFRLATMTDLQQTIETIPVRKDQFDSENDPGEQSLTSWWRRSQSSWHEGAGNLYQENNERVVDSASFYDSNGVDVFTPGRFSLLKRMVQNTTAPVAAGRIRTFAANSVRTNLCTNPSFETDTSSWAPNSGGTPADLPTLTRDTGKSFVGAASGRLDWATDDGLGFPPYLLVAAANTTANGAYSISLKVWVPTGSVGISMVCNGTLVALSGATKDAWVTLSGNGTADAGGVISVTLNPSTPTGVGQKFYVDACLIEAGTTIGAFFDGNSLNGAWTGTANKSTSTETIIAADVSVSEVAGGKLYTAPTVGGTFAALHSPATVIVDGLVAGSNFYDIASDGTLYSGAVSSPGSATTWPCGTTPVRLAWGKHRLWIIGGRKLWQPNLSLAGGSAQNPIFTHPNLGWNYTCMAEGASAMLFGGHDGFQSTIQSIVLDSGGGIPTLSGASVTAALPDGELVQELSVLAGQYVGIGTSRGFRVGIIGTSGQITYGPLLIEPTGVLACTALCAQGKFFVVAFRVSGGDTVAYRVDTSNDLSQLVFPYAKDISCQFVGAITSVASVSGTRLICTASDGTTWEQSLTNYVDTGYLLTGRIRFRTTEYKQFKNLGVEIEPLNGAIAVDLIKEGGSTLPLGSITRQSDVFTDRFSIESDRMRYASLKFTLTPSANQLLAPVINSYQLRALPAVTPQRLITLPLLCYDKEEARSGTRYGGKGYATDRLTALQLLEDSAVTVLFQDFTLGGTSGRTVIIEAMRFTQTTPGPAFKTGGAGGILLLQLRTVDA